MSDMIVPSLMLLLGQSPVLFVYVLGLILALVFWKRYPGPCLFLLIATVLLLVVSVTQTFATQYLIHARAEKGWKDNELGLMLSTVGLAGGVLRAVGFGFLLAAVFLGRGVAQRGTPSEALRPPGPALRPSEEQGITSRPGG
jgi:hypothetical protein